MAGGVWEDGSVVFTISRILENVAGAPYSFCRGRWSSYVFALSATILLLIIIYKSPGSRFESRWLCAHFYNDMVWYFLQLDSCWSHIVYFSGYTRAIANHTWCFSQCTPVCMLVELNTTLQQPVGGSETVTPSLFVGRIKHDITATYIWFRKNYTPCNLLWESWKPN